MYSYDLSQWILFFFLYSFLGWIWESCYVSVRQHRWVNRGFMHGPMLPLYGSGAMVVLIATIPVRDNLWMVFIMGMIGATTLEYITGVTMECMFHVRYWDYRNMKFNVKGYICPLATLCWGGFSILMVKVIHVPIEDLVLKIPITVTDILAFALVVVAAVDFTQSFNEAMDMKNILVQLEASREQIQKMQEKLKQTSEEMQEKLKQSSEEMQEKLKQTSEEMQERLKQTSEGMQERARNAAEGMQERLQSAAEGVQSGYQEYTQKREAEKLSRKEAELARLNERRRERNLQLVSLSEKAENLMKGIVPEKLEGLADSIEKWKTELGELKENAGLEMRKMGSRTNKSYENALKQLRRNPTAVSDRFKNAMEELKNLSEKKD